MRKCLKINHNIKETDVIRSDVDSYFITQLPALIILQKPKRRKEKKNARIFVNAKNAISYQIGSIC